jgi:Flp pilus assembly protein TadG
LILFAATAEFGRYFYEYTTLAKAARAGARYLSVNPVMATTDSDAEKIVVYGNAAGTGSPLLPDLATTHVEIMREGGSTVMPDTVTVKIVGYPHQPIFNLGGLIKSTGLSMNVTVKPSVTMRFLGQPPPI